MKTDEEIERYARFYALIEVELICWANGIAKDPIELMRQKLIEKICDEANASNTTPANIMNWNYPNGIAGPIVLDIMGRPHPRSIGASLEVINKILMEDYKELMEIS